VGGPRGFHAKADFDVVRFNKTVPGLMSTVLVVRTEEGILCGALRALFTRSDPQRHGFAFWTKNRADMVGRFPPPDSECVCSLPPLISVGCSCEFRLAWKRKDLDEGWRLFGHGDGNSVSAIKAIALFRDNTKAQSATTNSSCGCAASVIGHDKVVRSHRRGCQPEFRSKASLRCEIYMAILRGCRNGRKCAPLHFLWASEVRISE
jgi:hypothetical protein